jgi:hypothetical protein
MKIKSILFNFENILLIFWVGCLFSINSKIFDLFLESQNFLKISIIFLRIVIPVLVFSFLIFFFKIKKLNIFILIYLLYGVWQLIVFNPDAKYLVTTLENYHLIISMVAMLLIVHVAEYYQFKNIHIKILYCSIFFIGFISCYLSVLIIIDFFKSDRVSYLYSTKILISEARTLLQVNPRITGVSRMLGLILFFIFSLYICKKKKLFIFDFIFLLSIFIISFLIYGMQSKGSYISIILLLFYYIIFFKDKIIKKSFIIFIIFLLPIISFETILKSKIENADNKTKIQSRFLNNNEIIVNGELKSDYTTGRLEIWKRAFNEIKNRKIILGYGPQADRLLLTSENFNPNVPRHFYDANASNGLIYSYLCAGVIGLLFMLTLYSLIIYEVYKSTFIKKAFFNKNSYAIFSILTLSFLSVRTIFENGFTLFGIDYIFIIISYFILKKFNLENNQKKNIL